MGRKGEDDEKVTMALVWAAAVASVMSVTLHLIHPAQPQRTAYVTTTFDKVMSAAVTGGLISLVLLSKDARLRLIFGLIAIGSLMGNLSQWVPIEHRIALQVQLGLDIITALVCIVFIVRARHEHRCES
ncbi:MAG: hypothetical protein ABI383_09665 [Acidobacteriaceae bacterium]